MNQQPQAPNAAPPVHHGTYTVEHPEKGHFTLKLYRPKTGRYAGQDMIGLLVGPDNETGFRSVAFWNADRLCASVFKAHRCERNRQRRHLIDGYNWGDDWSAVERKIAIWTDLVVRGFEFTETGPTRKTDDAGRGTSYWSQAGYVLLLEGRCYVCGRKLTDPTSIRLGIGPKCGGRS